MAHINTMRANMVTNYENYYGNKIMVHIKQIESKYGNKL